MNTIDTKISVSTYRSEALDALIADIKKYPVMSVSEEIEAFEELAAASSEEERFAIKRRIANANLRFVLSVAKKYSKDGDTVAELVSIGTIGMLRAMDKFDLSKGFKFISHAVAWIRAEYSEYFRTDANFVRRSNNTKIGSKDKTIAERFLQTEMREPTEQELIDALEQEFGIEVKNKLDVVCVKTDYISDKLNSEDDSTMENNGEFAIATACHNDFEYEIEREEKREKVKTVLRMLTVKEQDIMCRYFGIDCEEETAESIAERFGYTPERIRQIVVNEIPKKVHARLSA